MNTIRRRTLRKGGKIDLGWVEEVLRKRLMTSGVTTEGQVLWIP